MHSGACWRAWLLGSYGTNDGTDAVPGLAGMLRMSKHAAERVTQSPVLLARSGLQPFGAAGKVLRAAMECRPAMGRLSVFGVGDETPAVRGVT